VTVGEGVVFHLGQTSELLLDGVEDGHSLVDLTSREVLSVFLVVFFTIAGNLIINFQTIIVYKDSSRNGSRYLADVSLYR
jgi:hypothetical protein